jgi:ribosomal protein S18 acetylase RimI-like enzyme
MKKIDIRPYIREDRTALRKLCCDVADRGGPIEGFFPDREVAADLLTKYYTDYEPQATFVAVADGQLAGYVSGCLDNRRYGLVVGWLLMPPLLAKAFKRGVFFRPQVGQLVKGALKNWRRAFSWRKKSFHSHQGRLHIGIAEGFRNQKIGRDLLKALLAYAWGRGISEIAASVHDGNQAASRFFETNGFVVRERYPMIMVRGNQEERYNSLLYVKTID